ncbi:hypothetical protein [Clostridium sp. D53t1_180928_C8]|uniref:hypothetical protein n=1 Tax=Clostridium sp. D53t1_180928_C8 TaxID=2787101 RepID=UPI0018AC01DF|nr:hypothetical protein [Clostridium sp. D53t1_180928_C8]
MKKVWENPQLKSLAVENTYEEEYDGWIIGDDGSRVDAKNVDRSVNQTCLGKYSYECKCCGAQSGHIYDTPVGAVFGLIAHWASAHPKGCKIS